MRSVNLARKLPRPILRSLYRFVEPGLLYLPSRERRRVKTAQLDVRDREMRLARAAGASLEALAKAHSRSVSRISEICRGVDPGIRFPASASRQVGSRPYSERRKSTNSSADTPTRSGASERVCARQDDAQHDGPAGRDADREPRRSLGGAKPDKETKTMSMTLTDAKAALAKLSFSNLAWIYRKAQGDKPPVGTSKATLLETMTEMFEEKAKAENGPATTEISIECETWLGEVAGDGKVAPKKAEAAPEPEKPTKSKQEKAIKLPKQPKPAKEPKPRDERLPAPGSTIKKVWRDRKLEVLVNESDFTFEGRTYRSLSKIASELQGCPSNGFLFFGLTEGAKAAAARRAEREAAKAATETAKAETPKPEKKAKATKQAKAKGSKKKASKK